MQHLLRCSSQWSTQHSKYSTTFCDRRSATSPTQTFQTFSSSRPAYRLNRVVWVAFASTSCLFGFRCEHTLDLQTSVLTACPCATATSSRTSVLGRRMVASCQPRILFHPNSLSGTNLASCLLVIWSNLVIQIPINRELDSWLQHLLTAVTGF